MKDATIRAVFDEFFYPGESLCCSFGKTKPFQLSRTLDEKIRIDEEGSTILTLTLPGYSKEDIDVEVGASSITVSSKKNKVVKSERTYAIPDGTDPDSISAEMKHGLLTIIIPKETRRKIL